MFSSLCWSNLLRGYLDLCPHCPRWKSQGLCAPLKVGWIFATDDVDDSWRWFMIVHRKLQPWFPENVLNISEPQIKACDIISNQGTRIQWIGFVGKIFTGNHVFFFIFAIKYRGFLYTVKQMFPLCNFSDSTSLRHFQRCSPPRESPFAVRKRSAAGLPVGWL